MKKVVVFGGSGFLGSHVADTLSQAGYQVIIYDRQKSPYLKSSQQMVIGDILNETAVEKVVEGCEVVYNFAGIADVDEAIQFPLESIRVNILGNSIILEACRKYNIKRFVFASSLYVYSKAGSFYRSSKQACELIIENYQEAFGLPYTILRYGSLYGPRANERNAIYHFIKDAIVDGKMTRRGDGEELREYIHVLDAAQGSVDILAEEYKNQYIILSGHQQMRVKDLLTMIKEMFENKVEIEYIPEIKNYHYEITPYAFAPKTGRKLIRSTYLDMGQGILEYIYELYRELKQPPTCEGIIVKNQKK